MLKELSINSQEREDHGRGGPPRWVWILLTGLLLLTLLAGAAWWWWTQRPLPVETATAQAVGSGAAANTVLQATGYVTARRQATVSTQITGTLTEVLIEEGDKVAKGQVLARLEDRALRAQLAAADAHVSSAQAGIALAQAQLAQAQSDERRQAELALSGMASRQMIETARTAVTTNAALLESRRRETDAARAQRAQAQVNFDYATVRAPFAGVVTVKAAQVGEIVSPLSAGGGFTRTGVGTIVDMDSLEVDVDINEAFIGQIRADMPCEAVLDAYPDWKIPAHVVAVVPSADRGKATVKVRVALEQKDGRVVPDMGVRVSFLADKPTVEAQAQPKGVLVPTLAVAADGSAFVVIDGRARQRQLKVGAEVGKQNGKHKLVSEGLRAGETVIVSPPAALRDGMAVVNKEAQ